MIFMWACCVNQFKTEFSKGARVIPFNGSGTFTVVNTFVPNTTILSAAVNQNFTDIATGLSDCLTRDGQSGMTAVLKAVSGSVSAPGITFNSDATAGLYLSSTGIVGLVAKSLGLLVNSAIFQVSSATVQAGGSGYAVGDTITETGGTAINQAVLTVATLSGSAVATVTVTYPGNYTVAPSNPVSQGSTSGVGTGCTLNLTFATQFTRSVVTNEAGAVPWQRLGSSSFVSGLMNAANALTFAQGIGSSALTTVIGQSILPNPQGILSPISSTTAPIPTSDQIGVSRIYWTPFKGNAVPIYNGTQFVVFNPAQLTCDLTAGAQVLGGIYDVYMFLNAGVPTLGFSPSWSAGTSGSVTAGSCARGTGAGGTAYSIINGIPVNTVQQTVNNSSSTFTMAANQGTYLGSVYVSTTAGQLSLHRSWGQSRNWGLWNCWNRNQIIMLAGDSTASWSTSTTYTTFAASNASSANKVTSFTGLAEEEINCSFQQYLVTAASNRQGYVGIGFNSTTAASGTIGTGNSISGGDLRTTIQAQYVSPPSLGINNIQSLDASSGTTVTMNGTQPFMTLNVSYRG